jgi:hypothetical protein
MLWEGIRKFLLGRSRQPSGFLGWLLSKHCLDLFKTFVVLTSLAICLIVLSLVLSLNYDLPAKESLTAVGVIIATWVTSFQFLSNAANARAGVAAVFESEISSIVAVIDSFGLVSTLTDADLKNAAVCETLKVRMDPRGENYMEAFARNVDRLANLPNDAVRETTAFYTYLKASRDAARVIGVWATNVEFSDKQKDVKKVLELLGQCFGHGMAAVTALAEDGAADRSKFSGLIQKIREYEKNTRYVS